MASQLQICQHSGCSTIPVVERVNVGYPGMDNSCSKNGISTALLPPIRQLQHDAGHVEGFRRLVICAGNSVGVLLKGTRPINVPNNYFLQLSNLMNHRGTITLLAPFMGYLMGLVKTQNLIDLWI